jgi:hypothetical protein
VQRLSGSIDALVHDTKELTSNFEELLVIKNTMRDWLKSKSIEMQKIRRAIKALEDLPVGADEISTVMTTHAGLLYSLELIEMKVKNHSYSTTFKKSAKGRPVLLDKILLIGMCYRLLRQHMDCKSKPERKNVVGLARWVWEEAFPDEQGQSMDAWQRTMDTWLTMSLDEMESKLN